MLDYPPIGLSNGGKQTIPSRKLRRINGSFPARHVRLWERGLIGFGVLAQTFSLLISVLPVKTVVGHCIAMAYTFRRFGTVGALNSTRRSSLQAQSHASLLL